MGGSAKSSLLESFEFFVFVYLYFQLYYFSVGVGSEQMGGGQSLLW